MTLSVVILCGGRGSRIKSVLGDIPKILAPIGTKAFIEYLVQWIKSSLISIPHNIVLSTCIGHQNIQEFITSHSLPCALSKEHTPLGTLGAVVDVIQKKQLHDYILVLNGDTIFDVDFAHVFDEFMANPDVPLLIVKPSTEPGRYGGYARSANGDIRFCDNGPQYISLGAFFCKRSSLIAFKDRLPSDCSRGLMLDLDFLDLSNINIFVLSHDVHFIDIGVPSDYNLAQNLIPSFFKS